MKLPTCLVEDDHVRLAGDGDAGGNEALDLGVGLQSLQKREWFVTAKLLDYLLL